MPLTQKQEKILADFAKTHAHWPKMQLDAALWQVKWALTALPHQKDPEDGLYDTFLMLAGRGSGKRTQRLTGLVFEHGNMIKRDGWLQHQRQMISEQLALKVTQVC